MAKLTEFKIKKHSERATEVVEVWYDGKFRATITPGDPDKPAFRVLSTHIANMEKSIGGVIDIYQFNLFED